MRVSVYHNSFTRPTSGPDYADGRLLCDQSLKKIFARGPQSPATLAKRGQSSANISADLAAIKKAHAAGRHPGLPQHTAQGDAPMPSRSVSMVKAVRQHALTVYGHRLPSLDELNKAFSSPVRISPRTPCRDASNMHLTRDEFLSKRARSLSSDQWNSMTQQQRRDYFSKGLTNPSLHDVGTPRGPQSSNSTWNDVHADTGASNNFRDQPVPSQRTSPFGAQTLDTPSTTDRDAAVAAVKKDLSRPSGTLSPSQRVRANAKAPPVRTTAAVQDATEDLDEDDDEMDQDKDSSDAKNPNRADGF
jgi:hypothetical protein